MRKTTSYLLLATIYLVVLYSAVQVVLAAPTGASIQSATTAGVPNPQGGNRTDARGTITTVVLSALQQDQNWKAYVGNITGKLSLDDAVGNTIYDWPLSLAKLGEVYLTRSTAPVFTAVSCANDANITAEETFNNMSTIQSDNINATFNSSSHGSFFVGTTSIGAGTCKATALYVNDTTQVMNGGQLWQEVLLQDSSSNLIFTTLINSSSQGFDNRPYDFQILVPESAVKVNATTYYFYTELG